MTTTIPANPFVLIDGSSYLFRAYHALPPLMNSKGKPTGAIYGVVNMVKRLLADYQPSQLAVVFDAKGKTFRHHLYPDYKANRPPMPDELREQIQPLHAVIKAMGLPLLVIDEVEADDVIGTLAQQAQQQGLHTLISTGDKDLAQLVNQDITLINTMTSIILDIEGVKEKFGVLPEQIIDYLSLIGDKVDNIPGVEKVGPKTAVKWLTQYSSLDNIIDHAEEIKGKVGDNLRATLEQLPLTKELVTLKCDVALDVTPVGLLPQTENKAELIALFKQLEFKTWLARALSEDEAGGSELNSDNEAHYEAVFTQAQFEDWLSKLTQAKCFAFDTETTSLDEMTAQIVGVSFALELGQAAYVPLAHDYEGAPQQLNLDEVLKQLKPILESKEIHKIGQNLKYDAKVLANYDIHMQGIAYDTMLESYVFNSTSNRHDMDTLALKYLGKNTIHYQDIAGKGAKQKTFNQITIEEATPYAAEDADITLQLHQSLWPKLQAIPTLRQVYQDIEIPLLPVLTLMERKGVLIDVTQLQQQSQEIAERLLVLEEEIHQLAGEEFNIDSPKQLQAILFEKLKLPVLQKTPKGQASTAEPVLQELAHDYPLPKRIIEYRGLRKLKSTYTDRLPEQVCDKTGRVHTSYHQAVAATGRLSSTDPNLQNIPIRNDEGRRIRKAFIAPKGYQILAADYSQIELRIMAHLSQDDGLITAFNAGLDVHKATAAEVFSTSVDEVSGQQRRIAKAINFGLIYGMSAFGLAKQLGIERGQAQMYMDLYFDRYPKVLSYMEKIRQQAHQQGFVETLFGRRLYLPEINAKNQQRQRAAERMAINGPMQGTAADIIKRAMIAMDDWLQQENSGIAMIMQVHDELVFEVPTDKIVLATEKIKDIMQSAASLAIPLIVDIGVGDSWDEAH